MSCGSPRGVAGVELLPEPVHRLELSRVLPILSSLAPGMVVSEGVAL